MDRRIAALTFALTLACFNDEPPDVPADEAGGELVSAFDTCVELLTAAAASDCADSCDASWCEPDVCSSMTPGEVTDACNALGIGEASFARELVDECVADECYFVMGICSAHPDFGPDCSDACSDLGVFEACLDADGCGELACPAD